MNNRMVVYLLGWLLFFEGVFLVLPGVVGAIYRESDMCYFFLTSAVCIVLGLLISRFKPKDNSFYAREGFVVVAISWILMSLLGALPYYMGGSIPSYIDAVFETASGLTTTGASICPSVEDLPKCVNFWRTFTHWIGGMGVLVFMMAVVPLAGGSNMFLMKAESPGPSVGKIVPKVKSTAKILYGLYIILSLLEFIMLLIGRMSVYDAITTTFGTAGTGGFGIYNDSFASFSSYIQIVVTVFMLLFGVNFSFYYLIFIERKVKDALKMSEVKLYGAIIVIATIIITINISRLYGGPLEALKHSAFQVVTIITTTGYATTDFDKWPEFSKTILVTLMFIGACAGSTGGGMKVSRVIIWFKTLVKELKVMIHPRNVYKVLVDGKKVEHEVVRSVNVYLVAYIVVFLTSVILISLDNFDFTTNFTGVAATINNIGPGLNKVGPTCNFSMYSAMSKIVLIFDMIVGRLELFPMLLLFSPSTWKK
ncbi:TrkH family potassium uptake protein [Eubacterium xylanophilum]|uniref:TrkH family potassium uptake protein n=1 Tax=Eubacterium xylanophilum TaxID=39497 RepID=UPI00047B8196|nr:TrkH family potassium uptake protein [Eubacterium xylanophilum]